MGDRIQIYDAQLRLVYLCSIRSSSNKILLWFIFQCIFFSEDVTKRPVHRTALHFHVGFLLFDNFNCIFFTKSSSFLYNNLFPFKVSLLCFCGLIIYTYVFMFNFIRTSCFIFGDTMHRNLSTSFSISYTRIKTIFFCTSRQKGVQNLLESKFNLADLTV